MNFIDKMVEKFIEIHRRMRRWRRVLFVLSAITVFAVTYALILPAITMDRDTAEEQPGIEAAAANLPDVSGEENDGGGAAGSDESGESPGDASDEGGLTDTGAAGQTDGGQTDDGRTDSGDTTGTDAAGEGRSEGSNAGWSEGQSTDRIEGTDTAATDRDASQSGATTDAETETAAAIELITEDTKLVFEGKDYYVYAEFGAPARLPVGVVLDVREITEEKYPEEYEEYYKQALSKMQDEYDENTKLSFARFYDIAFKYEDKEIEPAGEVKVRIEYKKALEIPKETTVDAIHFEDVGGPGG